MKIRTAVVTLVVALSCGIHVNAQAANLRGRLVLTPGKLKNDMSHPWYKLIKGMSDASASFGHKASDKWQSVTSSIIYSFRQMGMVFKPSAKHEIEDKQVIPAVALRGAGDPSTTAPTGGVGTDKQPLPSYVPGGEGNPVRTPPGTGGVTSPGPAAIPNTTPWDAPGNPTPGRPSTMAPAAGGVGTSKQAVPPIAPRGAGDPSTTAPTGGVGTGKQRQKLTMKLRRRA